MDVDRDLCGLSSEDSGLEYPCIDQYVQQQPILMQSVRDEEGTSHSDHFDFPTSARNRPEKVADGSGLEDGGSDAQLLSGNPRPSSLDVVPPEDDTEFTKNVRRDLTEFLYGGLEEILEIYAHDVGSTPDEPTSSVALDASSGSHALITRNEIVPGTCTAVDPAALSKPRAKHNSDQSRSTKQHRWQRAPTGPTFDSFEILPSTSSSLEPCQVVEPDISKATNRFEPPFHVNMSGVDGELRNFGDIFSNEEAAEGEAYDKPAAQVTREDDANIWLLDPNIPEGWPTNEFSLRPLYGPMLDQDARTTINGGFEHFLTPEEAVAPEYHDPYTIKRKTSTTPLCTGHTYFTNANRSQEKSGCFAQPKKRAFASVMSPEERAEDDARPARENVERAEKRRRIAQAPIRVDGFPEGNVPIPAQAWEDGQVALVRNYPNHLYGNTLKRLVEEFGWTARNLADQAGGGAKVTRNAMGKRVAKVMGRWKVPVKKEEKEDQKKGRKVENEETVGEEKGHDGERMEL